MEFSEWKVSTLNDICEYSKDRINIDKVSVGNYISTENMIPERGGVTSATTLPNAKSVTAYSKGDTLISNIRPYFKKIWYADKGGGASNDVLVLKSDKNKVDKQYLYYYLSQDSFFDYVMGTSKGTKMPRGDKEMILRYSIKLPSLTEQRIISNILVTIDAKIQTNNKINKSLQSIAKLLFKHWFIDFEFPDKEGLPYKSSEGNMVNSEYGIIPKGWYWGILDDVLEFYDSKRIPLSANQRENMKKVYPYYGAASLVDYVENYIFDGIYVLVSEDGANVVDAKGYPLVQYVWNKFWVNNHAHVIKGKNGFSEESIYVMLKNTNMQSIVTGAVQPKINQANLKSIRILIPTQDIMQKFNDITDNLFRQYRLTSEENQILVQIRDTLLPKLMNGEIDLSKLEINL